jgi:two-component system, chemotaxis family, protein-glutamate methylesterase/glutaminase
MTSGQSTVIAPIRAIVADDTSLYRRMLTDILKAIPGVEVVGAAFDGEDCLTMAEEIKRRKLSAEVIMVCSQTVESAEQTLQAFRIGALDMILKPNSSDFSANKKDLEAQLLNQVLAVRARSSKRNTFAAASCIRMQPVVESAPRISSNGRIKTPKCVCIGVSTGGPQALGVMMQGLPGDLPVPIFIVQHMPPVFTKSLADHLNRGGKIRVAEAVDGEVAINGKVYIAPGGKHMKVEKTTLGFKIRITNDAPIGSCKPSVDYLFNSVHDCVGGEALAIILTGMGSDGLAGCKRLHTSGARILAQDADSCVVYGMPRQIAENNLAHEVLPLNAIASRITQVLSKQSALCS